MKILNLFLQLIELQKRKIMLRSAIALADQKHKADNKQYFVIASTDGTLQVLNTSEIKALRKPYKRTRRKVGGKYVVDKHRILPKSFTHLDLMRECYYCTPPSLNAPDFQKLTPKEIDIKRKQWIEEQRNVKY